MPDVGQIVVFSCGFRYSQPAGLIMASLKFVMQNLNPLIILSLPGITQITVDMRSESAYTPRAWVNGDIIAGESAQWTIQYRHCSA